MGAAMQAFQIGAEIEGKVKHCGIYGALVDIGTGQDALLHVSQLPADADGHRADAVQPGSVISAFVYKTRPDGHVALTLEKPPAVPWSTIKNGNSYVGTVIRVEDFGVFVDFGAERPGMVHVSEMAEGYVRSPGDVAQVGQAVEVRVIKKSGRTRQIDLSMKPSVAEAEVFEEEDEEEAPTSMAHAFRRAMQGDTAGLTRQADKPARRARHRQVQEDILARTLRGAQN